MRSTEGPQKLCSLRMLCHQDALRVETRKEIRNHRGGELLQAGESGPWTSFKGPLLSPSVPRVAAGLVSVLGNEDAQFSVFQSSCPRVHTAYPHDHLERQCVLGGHLDISAGPGRKVSTPHQQP